MTTLSPTQILPSFKRWEESPERETIDLISHSELEGGGGGESMRKKTSKGQRWCWFDREINGAFALTPDLPHGFISYFIHAMCVGLSLKVQGNGVLTCVLVCWIMGADVSV